MTVLCPENYSASKSQLEEIMFSFKLQMEESVNLDEYIVTFGHKALSWYKYRSQTLKGIFHLKTCQMIEYHISEVLADVN